MPPLNHLIVYGQSLSVGQCAGTVRALSTTQPYSNLMLYDGVRADPYDVTYLSPLTLLPLVEQVSPIYPSVFGETPCSAMANYASQLILAEDGATSYKFAASAPGFGGTVIAGLGKGTSHFSRLLDRAYNVNRLGNAIRHPSSVGAILWEQGESDYLAGTLRATYSTALQTLATDLGTSLIQDVPQTDAPILIVNQIASHLYAPSATPTIALAQEDARAAAADVIAFGCPLYIMDYPGDDWHMDAESNAWAGAYGGLVVKRRLYDGDSDFDASMKIVSAVRNGDGIDVTLDPIGALAFDTTWVTALADGNYGFQVVDSGDSPVTVTGVTITGATTVRIACTAGGGAGSKVRYGWAGTAGQTTPGRVTGARGNLRDSHGASVPEILIEVGDSRPMHRWLRICEVATT